MPPPDTSTLSLHDALPIYTGVSRPALRSSRSISQPLFSGSIMSNTIPSYEFVPAMKDASPPVVDISTAKPSSRKPCEIDSASEDRKSIRLNSSHGYISYAAPRHLHSFPTRRSSDLHRRVAAGIAQLAQYFPAALFRQHHVQHDPIVRVRARHEGRLAAGG